MIGRFACPRSLTVPFWASHGVWRVWNRATGTIRGTPIPGPYNPHNRYNPTP